jgi:hypothetical protein
MMRGSPRQLVIEIERIRKVRRRIATILGYCRECRAPADLVDLEDLGRLFEVSVPDAVLQLRRRRIHLQHLGSGTLAVCVDSLLIRSDPEQAMLNKSLPSSSDSPRFTVSSDT